MKKITLPYSSNPTKFIFSENIDYFKEGNQSIWGKGDELTLRVLSRRKFPGKWLNLAAGDGRYNELLLQTADSVIATDIDRGALSKLTWRTPAALRPKLLTVIHNLSEPLPFTNDSFNGVFTTGILHLFPENQLSYIFSEIDRVLKSSGVVIFDFATDRKKVKPNGEILHHHDLVNYTLPEAKKLVRKKFKDYRLKLYSSSVADEQVTIGKLTYSFSCKFILVIGTKNSHTYQTSQTFHQSQFPHSI